MSGKYVPLITQYALKEFKKNDKELAGRFKGIIMEGPFMSARYEFRDGMVMNNTLFHITTNKQRKKYMKNLKDTVALSKKMFVLQCLIKADHILNPLQRYKPYSANFYDIRHTTFENRKGHLYEGPAHHNQSGYLLKPLMNFPYDMGHKIERF